MGGYEDIVAALLVSGIDYKIKNLFNQSAFDDTTVGIFFRLFFFSFFWIFFFFLSLV
jgi:hypothetical protein